MHHQTKQDNSMVLSISQKEHKCKSPNSFDIIQYCEEVRIQISPLDYLNSNLGQLQRLVEHCNNKDECHYSMNTNVNHHNKTNTSGISFPDEDLALPKLFQEEFIVLTTSPNQKPDPFLFCYNYTKEKGFILCSIFYS